MSGTGKCAILLSGTDMPRCVANRTPLPEDVKRTLRSHADRCVPTCLPSRMSTEIRRRANACHCSNADTEIGAIAYAHHHSSTDRSACWYQTERCKSDGRAREERGREGERAARSDGGDDGRGWRAARQSRGTTYDTPLWCATPSLCAVRYYAVVLVPSLLCPPYPCAFWYCLEPTVLCICYALSGANSGYAASRSNVWGAEKVYANGG
eukprot:323858-Rhodomonas_salina.9